MDLKKDASVALPDPQLWPHVGSMASTQTSFPGILCLYSVLAQGCHITPVLHFQSFNPSLSPTVSAEAAQFGVKGETLSMRLRTVNRVAGACRGWFQVWANATRSLFKFVLLLPTPFLFAMSLFWNFCCHVWVWLGARESQLLPSCWPSFPQLCNPPPPIFPSPTPSTKHFDTALCPQLFLSPVHVSPC